MTLIATLVTRRDVFQVSDRLLTTSGGPFDKAANKTVLYVARNGLLSISYSGNAYLDSIPTDQWIAERLWGRPLCLPGEQTPAIVAGRPAHWLDVGQAVQLLEEECRRAYERIQANHRRGLQLAIGGWQWKRRRMHRARPVCFEVNVEQPEDDDLSRYWHFLKDAGLVLSLVPEWAERLRWQFVAHLDTFWYSPRNLVEPLVNLIRKAAQESPVVGPDSLLVFIPHPLMGVMEVAYVGQRHHEGGFGTESGKHITFPVGYSPWALGPGIAFPPMLVSGVLQHPLGPFTFRVLGPRQLPGQPVMVHSAVIPQTRPTAPS